MCGINVVGGGGGVIIQGGGIQKGSLFCICHRLISDKTNFKSSCCKAKPIIKNEISYVCDEHPWPEIYCSMLQQAEHSGRLSSVPGAWLCESMGSSGRARIYVPQPGAARAAGPKKNGAHLPAQLRTPATRDRTAAEVFLKVGGRSTRTLLSWWKESSTETLFSHPALRYRSTVVRSDFFPFGFFALVNFVAAFSSFFFRRLIQCGLLREANSSYLWQMDRGDIGYGIPFFPSCLLSMSIRRCSHSASSWKKQPTTWVCRALACISFRRLTNVDIAMNCMWEGRPMLSESVRFLSPFLCFHICVCVCVCVCVCHNEKRVLDEWQIRIAPQETFVSTVQEKILQQLCIYIGTGLIS